MANTLKFGNGQWATKEGSTLAYNDENGNFKPLPFNVERDSIATRVNKQGLIEVVGKDKLRIDYTDSAKGVALLENSSTNLITYSEDFSEWSIISSGIVITDSTTDVLSPSGKNDASKVEFNAASKILGQSPTLSGNYSGFVYVKGTQGETIRFNFVGTEENFTLTGGWDKLERTNITATANAFNLNTFGGATARIIYVYGAQLESGNLSSYIPTYGSTYQRQADVVSGSGNSEVFNDSEGVLFADIASLSETNSANARINIHNGSATQMVRLGYTTSQNEIIAVIVNSGVQAVLSTIVSNITLYNKCVIKYKENDFQLWVSGFKVDTDTSGTTPSGLNQLSFEKHDGVEEFYGKAKQIGYYDATLTDSELEYLTSYRSLNELVTELNLNTL